MLTGHFYSRALAAHLTTYAALMIILMNQNPELSDCLKDFLRNVKSVFSYDIPVSEKRKSIKTVQLLECLNQVKATVRNSNDTAKL